MPDSQGTLIISCRRMYREMLLGKRIWRQSSTGRWYSRPAKRSDAKAYLEQFSSEEQEVMKQGMDDLISTRKKKGERDLKALFSGLSPSELREIKKEVMVAHPQLNLDLGPGPDLDKEGKDVPNKDSS